MKTFEAEKINNQANTKLLINYLEFTILDEIIWSSFVKDLIILNTTNSHLVIGVSSEIAKELLIKNYQTEFNKAAQDVLNNNAINAQLVFKDNYILSSQTKRFEKQRQTYINSKYTFDNYVVSKFNQKAYNATKLIVKQPGVFSPLFFYSTSGLGKTHLLHALGNEIVKQNQSVLYINPDKFTTKVTKAMQEDSASIAQIIDYYASFDFLLFDDLQNFGNRAATLKVLFNIINESIENERQVVFAADKSPNELGGFEDRFITRFSKGLTLEITKPEVNDLLNVLIRKLSDQNLTPTKWEDEALNFVARNYSTSIRSIEGAVTRIKFFSLDKAEIKYTYATVSNIFRNLAIDKAELTSSRVINVVANYYKVSKSALFSKTRKKNVVVARHMAMWLVRNLLHYPYQKIGGIFGNRDHSTVIAGVSRIDTALKLNGVVKAAVNTIKGKINKVS